jgi:hypothetical protein
MTKSILTITILCFAISVSYTQNTDETAVRGSISQFFMGMSKSDTTIIQKIMANGAKLETVLKSKDGIVSVRSESFAGFYKSVGQAPAGALDERLAAYDVKIDGDLATAWTPYSFYYNGKFSHCGANAFQLVRLAGQWRVWSVIDTRRREGCESKN